MEEGKEEKEEVVLEGNVEVENETTQKSEMEELEDRYKRLLAEFENFKKRSSKERETLFNMVTGEVILKMLPIMDNLEKAATAKTEDKDYQDGVNMVVKQFAGELEKFGLKEIETIGKRFDPELHEAVSHIDDAAKGEQEIVEEYRKGYQIGNKVVRHALVVVAN